MNNKLYNYIVVERKHKDFRKEIPEMAEEFKEKNLSPKERMTVRFERLCEMENPVFIEDERICFLRNAKNIPEIFTEDEWADVKNKYYIHEMGYHSNVCPNYEKVLKYGLEALKQNADEFSKRQIDALLNLVERYRTKAENEGRSEIAEMLKRVPRYGARSYIEALQSFRIISFGLWLEGNYHNNIGRFDQFAYPFYKNDIENGILTEEQAQEITEEFFLTFNRDNDLYPGVQQGDNGQSMMLGGLLPNGETAFNELSKICLKASRNLKLIDPKINVRVDKNTPDEVYTLCSELTEAGLGFPQYSNDDVVIPGLLDLGYDKEDALDYTVAACWEFIIPKIGADVANIGMFSFPKAIDVCLHRDLKNCNSAEEFLNAVKKEINTQCCEICDSINSKDLWFVPSPLLETITDWQNGKGKYNNFGIHGVGLCNAADSLWAVEKYVYGEKSLSPERLIAAVDTDFANEPELLHKLRFETEKVGSDNDNSDKYLPALTDAFANALEGKKNRLGGGFRAGTGSAMFYLDAAKGIPASPDGRRTNEPFGANYAVSLFARPTGPFSLIRSLTKPNLKKVINGGPLTVEFHNSVFASKDATFTVGQFVKSFILLGGHQLQLNAVNVDTLKDAQKHPEKYPLLIVRIWGWSAYFVELDKAFQDHVIARQEYLI